MKKTIIATFITVLIVGVIGLFFALSQDTPSGAVTYDVSQNTETQPVVFEEDFIDVVGGTGDAFGLSSQSQLQTLIYACPGKTIQLTLKLFIQNENIEGGTVLLDNNWGQYCSLDTLGTIIDPCDVSFTDNLFYFNCNNAAITLPQTLNILGELTCTVPVGGFVADSSDARTNNKQEEFNVDFFGITVNTIDPNHPQCTGCVPTALDESDCNDGQDNDCDGKKDCEDPDCSDNPSCKRPPSGGGGGGSGGGGGGIAYAYAPKACECIDESGMPEPLECFTAPSQQGVQLPQCPKQTTEATAGGYFKQFPTETEKKITQTKTKQSSSKQTISQPRETISHPPETQASKKLIPKVQAKTKQNKLPWLIGSLLLVLAGIAIYALAKMPKLKKKDSLEGSKIKVDKILRGLKKQRKKIYKKTTVKRKHKK